MADVNLKKQEIKEKFYNLLGNAQETYRLNKISVKPFQPMNNSLEDDLEATEKFLNAYDGEISKKDGFDEKVNLLINYFEIGEYSSALNEISEIKNFVKKQDAFLGRCIVDNINKSFSDVQETIRKYKYFEEKSLS